ncbi:hypothetical protein [Leptothoe spongobia]|uniref:Uncharacterized protein n=1 Tax=Leptothoe spongobia TAU-MAC 1115 TaxID=1967444 RepID=A0A947GKM7_9CYAN|nr:hypothetical protein [Leptothoe spongobia]MBT9316978.1 hypothetical protein [Leptothoe spongobia TAU-MAC 1115]
MGTQSIKKPSLQFILIVPFLLQIVGAVGLTGYFSLRNGQKAINNLASQLQDEVNAQVNQHLDSYLSTPQKIIQLTSKQIERGSLDADNLKELGYLFFDQLQAFEDFGYINYGSQSGEFIGVGTGLTSGIFLDITSNSKFQLKNRCMCTGASNRIVQSVTLLGTVNSFKCVLPLAR